MGPITYRPLKKKKEQEKEEEWWTRIGKEMDERRDA